MKTLVITLSVLFCVFGVSAQELELVVKEKQKTKENPEEIKTILGKIESNGGYGAVTIHYSQIANRSGMLAGGRMAWLMNHSFALGVGGYGFFNEPKSEPLIDNTFQYTTTGGYGGFFFEPIIGYKSPVHISLPIMFGGGGVAVARKFTDGSWNDYDYWKEKDYIAAKDVFFFLQPGVEIEMNMMRHFRMNFGVYYRLTTEVKLENKDGKPLADKGALNGITCGLTFKFGKF